MPDSLHPPYGTTTIAPRTLNRWLDVNPQNGPLRRTQTFITLPAFSQAVTWRGYSELVVAFNFEAPNNFSLKSNFTAPSSPNYVLCIMWEDSLRVTHRYSLWSGVGEVLYFPVEMYTGQLIKKNFRLEVWSTDSTPAVNSAAITFYTSVLGNSDYRYGVDARLVSSDAPVTLWGQSNVIPALPNDINNLMLQRFVSTQGFATPNWNSINDVSVISSADSVAVTLASGPNNFTYVKTTDAVITGAVTGTSNYIFAVVYLTGTVGNLINFDGGFAIGTSATHITVNGVDVVTINGFNKLYLLTVNLVNNLVTLGEIYTQITSASGIAASVPVGSTTLTLLSAASNDGIVEVFSYVTLTDFQGVFSYIFRKYGGFVLPLTFPTNNAPTVN